MSRLGGALVEHFERIRTGIDIAPILAELDANPDAWEKQTSRQEKAPAQVETRGIPIRGLRKSRVRGRRRRDVSDSRYTALSEEFPEVVRFIEAFAQEQQARPARARIAALGPGALVYRHRDRGDYYRSHDRYHLVLRSQPGALLRAGSEEVWMQPGELWWFDNTAPHDAVNRSNEERVHLVFDLAPLRPGGRRSPEPALTGFEDARVDLGRMLHEARQRVARHDAELVQEAVRLYLAGRQRPRRWLALLRRERIARPGEDLRPLRATIRLVGGETTDKKLRRRSRAMVWALERIEAGELSWKEVADAILCEGGVPEVARSWKEDQLRPE